MTFQPHIKKEADGMLNALQAMDIVFKIEDALIWHTGNMLVLCLQNACQKKYPAMVIIK